MIHNLKQKSSKGHLSPEHHTYDRFSLLATRCILHSVLHVGVNDRKRNDIRAPHQQSSQIIMQENPYPVAGTF